MACGRLVAEAHNQIPGDRWRVVVEITETLLLILGCRETGPNRLQHSGRAIPVYFAQTAFVHPLAALI
jgi:hypothetical protein